MRVVWKSDELAWLQIHALAERDMKPPTTEVFWQQFSTSNCSLLTIGGTSREIRLEERQCFVLDESTGKAVGTCTSWIPKREDSMQPDCGRLHWLAVVPGYQKRGLGAFLIAAAIERMKDLGHTEAYLSTWSDKLPAIRLYQKAGFEPVIRNEAERRQWHSILMQQHHHTHAYATARLRTRTTIACTIIAGLLRVWSR
jgi:ribosomal protein S18 acetylase RimI-like enzyme